MGRWHVVAFMVLALASLTVAQDYSESTGLATAAEDQWDGFKYEELGLTQWEFQQAREGGMSRDRLLQLIEVGIRPGEYLQKPWVRLGVTEETWIAERTAGMEDSDIDRSYRNKTNHQDDAYISLLLPSWYQWKTGKTTEAITINAIWATSVGIAVYLAIDTPNNDESFLYPVIGLVHILSFAQGFMETQWENNPDANRFSFDLGPTANQGAMALLRLKF